MINAAIVGLGWWGGTLVEAVQGTSDKINFVAAHTRSRSEKDQEIAAKHGLQLADSYEDHGLRLRAQWKLKSYTLQAY